MGLRGWDPPLGWGISPARGHCVHLPQTSQKDTVSVLYLKPLGHGTERSAQHTLPPLVFGGEKGYCRGAVSWSSGISLKREGLSSFCADLSTASNRKLLRVLKNLQAPVTPGSSGEPALVWARGAGAEPPGWSVPRCAGGWCPLEGRGSLRRGVTGLHTCFR